MPSERPIRLSRRAFATVGTFGLLLTACGVQTTPTEQPPRPLTYKERIEQSKEVTLVDMTLPEGRDDYNRLTRDFESAFTPIAWDYERLTMIDNFLDYLPEHLYRPQGNNRLRITVADQANACGCDGVIDFSFNKPDLIALNSNMFTNQDLLRSFEATTHELTHRNRRAKDSQDLSAMSSIFGGDYVRSIQTYNQKANALSNKYRLPEMKYFKGDILYGLSKKTPSELIPVLAAQYTHGRDLFTEFNASVFGLKTADNLYIYVGENVFNGYEYKNGFPMVLK